MPLDVDEQSRVAALAVALQSHQAKQAAAVVVPPPAPLFIRNPDGSVVTRAGVQVRGPLEKIPPKA